MIVYVGFDVWVEAAESMVAVMFNLFTIGVLTEFLVLYQMSLWDSRVGAERCRVRLVH